MGAVSLTIRDYDNEPSVVAFNLPDITAANADAVYADALAIQQAVDAATIGNLVTKRVTGLVSPLGVGRASDPQAQRESKMRISMYDSVTYERSSVEVPCADLTKQLTGHPGYFYIAGESGTDATIEALRQQIEASVLGAGGNAVVVEEMLHVGRSI